MRSLLGCFLLVLCSFVISPAQTAGQSQGTSAGREPISLAVDATEAPRNLFHAKLVIPSSPGPLTLYYPEWIPGEHGPTGPIVNLAGLKFTAAGKTLQWQRDPVDMYAFHLEVPQGATNVEASLDFLAPTFAGGFTAGASTTSHLAIVTWNELVLYPQGFASDNLTVKASLRLPGGWKYGTSLPVERDAADRVDFEPVSLTTLVDSPVLAGQYFRVVPLATTAPTAEIDVAADSAAALEMSPEFVASMRKLVGEAAALFGAQHYRNYHFLFTLSDRVAHFGLEHHQSNDSRVAERALTNGIQGRLALGVLSHEYVHSWNGKYRRPVGLATPDYQQPMKGELLWVYEGLTQYLGNVLAARSGLWTPEMYRERLAQVAAALDHRPGRTWRPLVDTAVAAQLLYGAPGEWVAERRSTDFYDEGWLIWLDVDTTIRQQTGGRKSIDDFCHLFHGAPGGPPMVKTYTFDDVVNTLNEVTPYDWRGFLNARLYTTDFHAPLGGIERGGGRLVYGDHMSQFLKELEEANGSVEMGYSVGLRLNASGLISDVIEGMPAARAGLGPGMRIVAVNGKRYSPDVLHDEVRATKTRNAPLNLTIDNEGAFEQFTLQYREGERYPLLERDASKPDILGQIIAPRTSGP